MVQAKVMEPGTLEMPGPSWSFVAVSTKQGGLAQSCCRLGMVQAKLMDSGTLEKPGPSWSFVAVPHIGCKWS